MYKKPKLVKLPKPHQQVSIKRSGGNNGGPGGSRSGMGMCKITYVD